MSVKERNIARVTEYALKYFIQYGIEGSKISDIANEAELTERSVFRYFNTKADLVLAAVFLFWKNAQKQVNERCSKDDEKTSGIEKISTALKAYSEVYFTSKKELIFLQEAEIYLYREGKIEAIEKRQLIPYENSQSALALAIQQGLRDGTVRNDIDIETLYHNTLDSLLGLIQKIALLGPHEEGLPVYTKKRLTDFCENLLNAYKKQ